MVELLEANRGISILGNSDLFKRLVIRKIVEEAKKKEFELNSAFGKAIFISNKIKPTKYSLVISTTERPNFRIIDLHNPKHFKQCLKFIDNVKDIKLPNNEVIVNIDSTYLQILGFSHKDKSYTSIVKEFIINILILQPIDDEILTFINNYYQLFSKIVEDLLEGIINLSEYYLTIVSSHKRQLIALANILIKTEELNEFILYYDKKVRENESL